jgi:hypothetical protein
MPTTIDPHIFSEAVRFFWTTRERQAQEQTERGNSDQGARGAVTGGKQMDGFLRKIIDLLQGAGVDQRNIHTRMTDLPGYFRPTKDWDLVVVEENKLRVVIELKSQVGPSFGNNFNNRTEEALGNAEDIWTAYREKAFFPSPEPWVGYLFLLEKCDRSMSPVRVAEPHYKVFPEFSGASYAKRYEILCRKLVLERKYSSACFLLSDRRTAGSIPNYEEPGQDINAETFVRQMLRAVAKV